MKLSGDSKIRYEISAEFDSAAAAAAVPDILPVKDYYVKKTDAGYALTAVSISGDAEAMYDKAEAAFHKNEFPAAIALYNKTLELQPDYFPALMSIGDSYYQAKMFDSAMVAFRRAITFNFLDYHSHWFLADTYREWTLTDSAMREITIAHVLNVANKNLKKAIVSHRESADRTWDEWNNSIDNYFLITHFREG